MQPLYLSELRGIKGDICAGVGKTQIQANRHSLIDQASTIAVFYPRLIAINVT